MSTPEPPLIVFVDPEAGGHHIALYGRIILREILARGWKSLWLTSSFAAYDPAAIALREEFGECLQIEIAPFPRMPQSTGGGAWALYEIKHYFVLRRALLRLQARRQIAAVYLAWIDFFPRMLGAFGPPVRTLHYCGLHMHPPDCTKRSQPGGPFKKMIRAISMALNNRIFRWPQILQVAMIVEDSVAKLRTQKILGIDKLHYIPDVVLTPPKVERDIAREAIGASEADSVLLLFGAITDIKGVPQLLAACRQISAPEQWIIVFAGRQQPDIASEISRHRTSLTNLGFRIIEWNRFISDSDAGLVFAAADIVWMGYTETIGSSGVLYLAGACHRAILASDEGYVGKVGRLHSLGPVVNVHDPTSVAKNLEELRASPALRTRFGENGARLAAQHLPLVFAPKIGALIEKTIGESKNPPISR